MFTIYISFNNGQVEEREGQTYEDVQALRNNPPVGANDIDVQYSGDATENQEFLAAFINSQPN